MPGTAKAIVAVGDEMVVAEDFEDRELTFYVLYLHSVNFFKINL